MVGHNTCSVCGAEVSIEAKACGSCGSIIVPPSEPPPAFTPPAEAKAGSGRLALIVGSVLLLSVLGAVLFLRAQGTSSASMSPEELRQAREALEAEWESKRDQYFALAAKTDLVEREDMDLRRVVLKAGVWAQLSPDERRVAVELLALKTSVRLTEARRGRIELVEGTTVVASYEPERGVVLR